MRYMLILLVIFAILVFGCAKTSNDIDPGSLIHDIPKESPPSPPLTSRLCQASDAASFKSCANKLNNNQVDEIKITSLITCTGTDACRVNLNGINRPVSVYGQNSNAGFKRLDTYNYDMITITNSEGVKIYNLIFDENENQPCAPLSDPNNCVGTILVSNSKNIAIDNVTISHSKKEGVEAYNSDRITIINSKFINAYLFGVILNSPLDHNTGSSPITSAQIEGNLFKDIKSNALVLYTTQATEENPLIISGNTFINNHRENVYFLCGQSGNEPCPGGQLYIPDGAANVVIKNNVIKDGGSPIGTGGIEFGVRNIRNVEVIGNEVYNNNMWGIYVNPGPQNVNILISKNKVYNNGLLPDYRGVNINIPPGGDVIESGNCFTASCVP